MVKTNWQAFYGTLSILPDGEHRVEKPTLAQLDQFEASAGFKLPTSYRDFILVFGPGEFSSGLEIAAPGYANLVNPVLDLYTANSQYGYTSSELAAKPEGDRKILSNIFYFGLEDGRNWLGWDLSHISDTTDCEYAIYRVGLKEIGLIALSFNHFIEQVANRLFDRNQEWNEDEMGPLRVFRPAAYNY